MPPESKIINRPLGIGRKRKISGFNLIEAAIVLGLVGLVIGGIWVAAGAVMHQNRQRDFQAALLQIVTEVTRLSYRQTLFFDVQTLQAMGLRLPVLGEIALSGAAQQPNNGSLYGNSVMLYFSRPDGSVSKDDCVILGRAVYSLGGASYMTFDDFQGDPTSLDLGTLDSFIETCSDNLNNSAINAYIPLR